MRPTDVIMSKCKLSSLPLGPLAVDSLLIDKVANTLGYGSSGLVIRAQDRVTGTFVAVKILHHVDDDSQSDQQAREMRMYQKLLAGCDPRIECASSFFPMLFYAKCHSQVVRRCSRRRNAQGIQFRRVRAA